MTSDLHLLIRAALANHASTCAAIRAVASERRDLTIDELMAAFVGFNINHATVRTQALKARREIRNAGRPMVVVPAAVSLDYRQEALAEIERCRDIATKRWGVTPMPRVTWTAKGRAAGYATGTGNINLNDHIARHEGKAFLVTAAHEFAHCVVFALSLKHAGRTRGRGYYSAHGECWQEVMRSFGHHPRRCHNYASATPSRVVRTREVKCSCKTHAVTESRWRKIRDGMIVCRCRLCRQPVAAIC